MTETVNHPGHYGGEENPYETIKVIEAMGIGFEFCVGNAVKYLMRAGKKGNATEDLRKAAWYCERAAAESDIRVILGDPPENPWDEEDAMITVRYLSKGSEDPWPTGTWSEYATGQERASELASTAARYFGRMFTDGFALKVPGDEFTRRDNQKLRDFAKPGDVLFLVEA